MVALPRRSPDRQPEAASTRRRYALLLQLGGIALLSVGLGVLTLWLGIVAFGVGLLVIGVALELD